MSTDEGMRPMEDAPRDKTWVVLVGSSPSGKDAYVAAYWDGSDNHSHGWHAVAARHHESKFRGWFPIQGDYTAGALAMKEAAADQCDGMGRVWSKFHAPMASVAMNLADLIRALPVPPRGSTI